MILKPLLLILSALAFTGCATTETVADKATADSSAVKDAATSQSSYELALLHIKTLREGKYNLDQPAYERGLQDALNGSAVDVQTNQTAWQALAAASYEEVKTANLAAGKAFLEQNKTRKGVITLPSGVQYEVLKEGKTTQKPTLEDSVGILYKIAGIDGTVKVDTMPKEGRKMYEIPLQKVFSKGWQEALLLMPLESRWRIYIPGELAFGENGLGEKRILPNETLVIETHLDSILPPKK